MQAESGQDLVRRLAGLLEWLQKAGCTPVDRPDVAGGKAAVAPEPRPDWCEIHQAAMGKHEKDNQVWYSHKAPDGRWCRGGKKKRNDRRWGGRDHPRSPHQIRCRLLNYP